MSIGFSMTMRNEDFVLNSEGSLPSDQTIALIGKSGSGKTTFLRCLAGLEKSLKGTIKFREETWHCSEKNIFLPPENRRIGYVFQHGALFPNLTVSQNIEYASKRRKGPLSDSLKQAIEATGIAKLSGREANTLSGGETQRVAIARALTSGPRLLLLDEPLSALDWEGRAELVSCLESALQVLDIPTIFVTHTLADAAELAKYAIRMDSGNIVDQGPAADILPKNFDLAEDRREPFVTLDSSVITHDEPYSLTVLSSPIGELIVPKHARLVGPKLRVSIWARDVSLSLQKPEETSLLNAISVKISHIEDFEQSRVVVTLNAGTGSFKSLITKKSADNLNLETGKKAYGLIKSVSFT